MPSLRQPASRLLRDPEASLDGGCCPHAPGGAPATAAVDSRAAGAELPDSINITVTPLALCWRDRRPCRYSTPGVQRSAGVLGRNDGSPARLALVRAEGVHTSGRCPSLVWYPVALVARTARQRVADPKAPSLAEGPGAARGRLRRPSQS
eukprot:scaffold3166_cov399-Prasinococcus_capsulatus_cf.AAC.30